MADSDVWDDSGDEYEILEKTSARFEEQIKSSSFKEGLDNVDEDEYLQEGFNNAFSEAVDIYKPLGHIKKQIQF
jgi:hypothetical protein